jgi:hypothetical protein
MNECLCCGYKWKFQIKINNSTNNSRNCPKCFSYYWDVGNNVKCFCCEGTLFFPLIHHKDGNHYNNLKDNRIVLCKYCHCSVHHNIGKTKSAKKTGVRRFAKPKIKNKIIELQECLL